MILFLTESLIFLLVDSNYYWGEVEGERWALVCIPHILFVVDNYKWVWNEERVGTKDYRALGSTIADAGFEGGGGGVTLL